MRFITFGISALALTMLSILPASAQNVTLSAYIVNPAGPIEHCPVMIRFRGFITATGWSPTANRQVQFKWIRSDGADAPTQTLNFPAGADRKEVDTTWTLSADGTNWEALQVSYPPITNNTSNHAVFTLTCPTPGSLTKPSPLIPK